MKRSDVWSPLEIQLCKLYTEFNVMKTPEDVYRVLAKLQTPGNKDLALRKSNINFLRVGSF